MPEDVRLIVEGEEFGGWKSLRVTRSIETLAGSFSFELSEKFPADPTRRRLQAGLAAEIRVAGKPLIAGYLDAVERSYDRQHHAVTARGRDAAGDLVDCAHDYSPGAFRDIGLLQLAGEFAKPFGIGVLADTEMGESFKEFQVQVGETGFEALARACRLRSVLPISDGKGSIVLARAGSVRAPTALVLGGNILSASSVDSMEDRFSKWTYRSQERVVGKGGTRKDNTSEGSAEDSTVLRHRPMVRVSRQRAEAAVLQQRAQWSVNVAAGRANRVQYVVAGFRHRSGFWAPNQLVPVEDPYAGVRGSMLITTASFEADREKQETQLSVGRPEAFLAEPIHQGKKGQELWGA